VAIQGFQHCFATNIICWGRPMTEKLLVLREIELGQAVETRKKWTAPLVITSSTYSGVAKTGGALGSEHHSVTSTNYSS
jgi:hypothetical protein